ncbi:MAG: carboxypeptidase regulatory-like domain-containing protein [Pirellulales bacterium]|nr:carboxypeptidase regulatory-like domain-containing protein [Pirellulales bacterium]
MILVTLTLACILSAATNDPGSPTQQVVSASGQAPITKSAPAGQQTVQGKGNQPVPTKTILGTVVDEDGKPVPGAQVWMLTAVDNQVTTAAEAKTGKDGRFALELALDRVIWDTVWALAPDYSLSTGSAREALADEKDGPELKIVLQAPVHTEFLILTPEGKRLAGAFVGPYHVVPTASQKMGEILSSEILRTVGGTTGADGQVSLPGLPRAIRASERRWRSPITKGILSCEPFPKESSR